MMTTSLLLILAMFSGMPAGEGEKLPSAEVLFRDGLKAYDAHDYPHALASFEAAYRLTPRPEILFDIAMTHRSAGDCPQAAKSFDAFIAAAPPNDPLLPRAQARRYELASCAPLPEPTAGPVMAASAAAAPRPDSAPPAPETPPKPPGRPVPPPLSSPPPAVTLVASPARPASLHSACAGAIGSGVVLAAAGALFGVRAWSAGQEAESAGVWDETAQRADERERNLQQTSTLLLISAGVASLVAAGTCSYGTWWGRNNSAGRP